MGGRDRTDVGLLDAESLPPPAEDGPEMMTKPRCQYREVVRLRIEAARKTA
jgi:hypothetical protein